MRDRDERERAEAPKHEGVSDPRQRPLSDDFGLQQNFPDKLSHSRSDRRQLEICVPFGSADRIYYRPKPAPEGVQRRRKHRQKQEDFDNRRTEHECSAPNVPFFAKLVKEFADRRKHFCASLSRERPDSSARTCAIACCSRATPLSHWTTFSPARRRICRIWNLIRRFNSSGMM